MVCVRRDVIWTGPPVPFLLYVHNVLRLLEIGFADQAHVDDFYANDLVGSPLDFRTVPLATIKLVFRGRWRRVTLLIDDTPASVDRIAQHKAQTCGRDPSPLADFVVSDVAGEEEPECFSNLLCAWRIEPSQVLLVADAIRQSYLALGILDRKKHTSELQSLRHLV